MDRTKQFFGWILGWLAFAAGSAVLSACGMAKPPLHTITVTAAQAGLVSRQVDIFTISGPEGERQAVEDVAGALEKLAPQVRRDLALDYRAPVRVTIYPDQERLDAARADPDNRGFYAYSEDNNIYMVSPRNPIPTMDIPYEARVGIAVHEFAHIVIGAANPDAPLWLNEGAAVYVGPHAVYSYVCEKQFPFGSIPDLAALERSYGETPGADLFSYAVVDYAANTYGMDRLNRLIRSPEKLEEIFGVSRAAFEQGWRKYMEEHYRKP